MSLENRIRHGQGKGAAMGHEYRRLGIFFVLGMVTLITSQDASSFDQSRPGIASSGKPLCSELPAQASIERMKAIQSLRETQVEIQMMKQQQGGAANR